MRNDSCSQGRCTVASNPFASVLKGLEFIDKFGVNGIIDNSLQKAAEAMGIHLSKAAQAIRKEMTEPEYKKLKGLGNSKKDNLEKLDTLNGIGNRIKDPAVKKELDDISTHKQDIVNRINQQDQ